MYNIQEEQAGGKCLFIEQTGCILDCVQYFLHYVVWWGLYILCVLHGVSWISVPTVPQILLRHWEVADSEVECLEPSEPEGDS